MEVRIKLIRKMLELSQKEFAKKIGIGDTAISKLELGARNPSEQTIKSICREYNVNREWLEKGEGEIFNNLDDKMFIDIINYYQLGDEDLRVLKKYLLLSKEDRAVINKFIG